MSVDAVEGADAGAFTQSLVGDNNDLGKDEFLKLLVAQLGNQDPLNPMDDKEFIAQLAQFSSLEQQISANKNLEMLAIGQTALANSQITDLIGKKVRVQTTSMEIDKDGEAPDFNFELRGNAASIQIKVYSDTGDLVRTIDVGSRQAGKHNVEWDGLDNEGNPVTPGEYHIKVEAVDEMDEAVSVTTESFGTVTGVSFDKGYAELLVGDIRVRPGDVLEIKAKDSEDDNNE
jgi:flagellar basal-body rod modification protein FlgD